MTRRTWFLAAWLAVSPAWSGPGISQSSASGNQFFATVDLLGGAFLGLGAIFDDGFETGDTGQW